MKKEGIIIGKSAKQTKQVKREEKKQEPITVTPEMLDSLTFTKDELLLLCMGFIVDTHKVVRYLNSVFSEGELDVLTELTEFTSEIIGPQLFKTCTENLNLTEEQVKDYKYTSDIITKEIGVLMQKIRTALTVESGAVVDGEQN